MHATAPWRKKEMDFTNVAELLEGMKSYCDSHDIRNSDLINYDAFALNRKPDPRLKSLVDKDKYGEYLGLAYKSWTGTSDTMGINRITVYLRPDDRVAGVWNSVGGMLDSYELFEYHDGYHTGALINVMGPTENWLKFTYYIEDAEGRVTEILSIYGGMVSYDSKITLITRMLLGYEGGETILKSSVNIRYKKTADGFAVWDEEDNLSENEPVDRVIDDQKELCKKLKKNVKSCKTLEEVVETFFDVISEAEENPEEEVSYTAGTSPLSYLPGMDGVMFNLMRWTPTEDDEYYQLQLDVEFELDDEKIPYDNMNDENDVAGMKDRVLETDSFKALAGKKIKKIKVSLVET